LYFPGELVHPIYIAFLLSRLILILLVLGPQRFWFKRGWRLTARFRSPAWKLAGHVFLAVAGLFILLVFCDGVFHRFLPARVGERIRPVVQLWLFTSTFAFLCVKVVHAAEWLWSWFVPRRSFEDSAEDPTRRTFFRYAASFVGAVPFIPAVYGFTQERMKFQVVRVDVPVANLPPALDGFRIAQLSDIHAGDFMPPHEIRRAVEMANSLTPHIAVVTGDLVSGRGDPLAECVAELSRLKAPLGLLGCNGNHEIYAGAEDEAEKLYQQYGMKMLRRASTQLSWNGAELNLIGVDYQHDLHLTGSRMPTLPGVAQLVRQDMPNILLAHDPNAFYRAAELGIDLTISGHTHGGQVNVEVVKQSWSTARLMTRFIAGLYRRPMPQAGREAFLYVNRGLGTLAVPVRLGAPPEITLLTLRSAQRQ
jgi:predicted MPP superfamily phosphohydrolase